MLAQGSHERAFQIVMCDALSSFWASAKITDQPVAAINFLRSLFIGGPQNLGRPATENSPAWAAAWNDEDAILVVHGTDLDSQYVPQFNGFISINPFRTDDTIENPISSWSDDASFVIYEILRLSGFFAARHRWYVGHSAGHGISQGVAVLEAQRIAARDIATTHILSFGGNATLNRSKVNYLQGADAYRVMNADDPVPLMPWAVLRILGSAAAMTPRNAQRVANFVHFGSSINLKSAGGFDGSEFPSEADVDATTSVFTWMRTFQTGNQSPHWITVYKSRLQAVERANAPVMPTGGTHRVSSDPPQLDLPPMRTVVDAGNFTRQLAEELNTRLVASRLPPSEIVSTTRFYVRKNNGIWCVMRKGGIVTTEKGKRRAKSVARSWNRLLAANAGLVIPFPE